MIKRVLAALALAVLAMSPAPARAQTPAEVQASLADIGTWMQDYQAVMAYANEPFLTMESFYAALDGFADGSMSARRARRAIEQWNERAIASMDRARASANALREPPHLSLYGPDGAALEAVLVATRNGLGPTLDEMERVIETSVSLGLGSLDDRAKGIEARERAFYNASIQLTQVDRARIDISAAMIPADNPNQALMVATQHYYDSVIIMPRFALETLDGGGDRRALIESLRRSARALRSELARGRILVEQIQMQAREMQAGPGVELGRLMLRMVGTFPESFAAYEGLAVGIDDAVRALELGADVRDVWAQQEASDRPHLDEIDRLERVRAAMLAENQRRPL